MLQFVSSPTSSPGSREASPAMRRAAEQFEVAFLAQILRDFTSGAVASVSGGEAAAFAGMLQDEYARLISRSGGIGLAGAVLRAMLEAQETE